jgi:Mrp family chromosome partitioning ATPase
MSKNFELLQEIGNDEDLFQTSDSELAGAALSVIAIQRGLDVDKAERERVLRNASLPSVLVPVDDSPVSLPSQVGESLEATESVAATGPHTSSARVSLQTGGTLASPTDVPFPPADPILRDDQPQTEQDPISGEEQHTAHRSILSLFPNTEAAAQGVATKKGLPTNSFGLTWVDIVKAGIRHWVKETAGRIKYEDGDWASVAREEELKLVERVFPATPANSRRVALFSALEDDRGCASLCARTAKLLATRRDGPVCVVDANFDFPTLHQCFAAENAQGLSEAALESALLPNFLQQLSEPDLWLMPCGQAASKLTFSAITDGLRQRMIELRKRFKYVVVHAGPLRVETCALHISRWTDGVVVVVEANCTRRDSAKRVKETLLAANANLLGVVLNNRTFPIPEGVYHKL